MSAPLLTCELTDDGHFRPRPPVPSAMLARFPGLARPGVDVNELFPFIAHFAEEADAVWQGDTPASLRSEPWDEVDAQGNACALEAIAVRTLREKALLIGFADGGGASTREVLQAARAHALALERLRKAHESLRTLADGAPVMIWMTDARGSLVHVNRTWCEFTGQRADQLADAWGRTVHPDDQLAVRERIARGVREQAPFELEFRMRRADASFCWVLASCTPRHGAAGVFDGHVGCCLDISVRRAAVAVLEQARGELQDQLADRTEQVLETNRLLIDEVRARRQANEQLLAQRAELRRLAERLTLAEERERRRIADGLHDHVGQALAVAKLHLGMLLADVPPAVAERVSFVRSLVEEGIEHTRSLTFDLAPHALHELGLVAALESLAADTLARYGLTATCHDDGVDKPVSEATRTILFLAVRELVHNVAKHAQARNVRIVTRREDTRLRIDVEDDGVGFVVAVDDDRQVGGGYGLLNVRERVEHLGGGVAIDSAPGRGTRVVLTGPIDESRLEERA